MATLPQKRPIIVNDPFPEGSQITMNGEIFDLKLRPALSRNQDDFVYDMVDPAIVHPEGTLPFIRLTPGATLPTRGYPDDAGLDLYSSESRMIGGGVTLDVPTGIAAELPEGTFAMIVGRSSTTRKHGLQVLTGIIDRGYRGELFIQVHNPNKQHYAIGTGIRLGQLILFGNETEKYTPLEVERLNNHDRGLNGFGSTGE